MVAGEKRITPVGRYIHRVEHGPEARVFLVAVVGVPAELLRRQLLGIPGCATQIVDTVDIGLVWQERLDFQFAKATAEIGKLLLGQLLVVEHQHRVVEIGLANLLKGVIGERAEVCAVDLGSQSTGDGADINSLARSRCG